MSTSYTRLLLFIYKVSIYLNNTTSNIYGGRMQFSASSQFFYAKNQFSVILVSFFSFYISVPGRGCFFLVINYEEEYFDERMIYLADFNEKLFKFLRKYQFGQFLAIYVLFQIRFSQRTGKISRKSWSISWGRLLGTFSEILSFLPSKWCGACASHLPRRLFPKSVTLAGCSNFRGVHF